MKRRSISWALSCLLLACSDKVQLGDQGDASSAGPGDSDAHVDSAPNDAIAADASGYLECMNASGQLNTSLKTCRSDAECAIEEEQTDCCMTMLYVGVNTASTAKFVECEAAWLAHFIGPCGCPPGQTKTEDGTVVATADAAGPFVHCTSGGLCMTYTP
jgi:hypothetical protein